MRLMVWLATALLVTAAMLCISPTTRAHETASSDCPVTKPNGVYPPEMANNNGNYGNDSLWTNLSMWSDQPGIVEVPNDPHIGPDGSVNEMKWAWYRFANGQLTIECHRLDAEESPLVAWIPEGYGDTGFQVSGLTFPSAGCWEITGIVNDSRLTFVVLVVMPPDWEPEAAPEISIPRFDLIGW